MKPIWMILGLFGSVLVFGADKRALVESPLDRYVREATEAGINSRPEFPGSLYNPDSQIADMARDLRSRSVNDLVIIKVVEQASAVSSGDVKSSRQTSLKAGVDAIGGLTRATGPLANLAGLNSSSSIDGAASTGRETSISTSLAARVTHVLPNGYLVVEGTKEVQVNSERQVVTVRGVVRPNDLANNTVLSDHLAQLEVRINGKGVVADAIRRPFILYRLLMGILPL
ncbi:MAG: flagellar basal body L-ring protein FlgH [Acidobacteriota bacterium]